MTIIKKSGKKEDFSAEKLSRSISAASGDANEPLNESDLKILLAEFRQLVSGKELMTTQQIDVVMNGILYSKGYYGILEHYVSYSKRP